MVSTFPQMQPFYRPNSTLTIDTSHAQKYYEEEDSNILDENILDHSAIDSGLEMSPPMADSRRESYAVSSTLFSPKTEDWQSVDMQSVPSNNPFTRVDSSQGYNAQAQWPLGQPSGTCTPLPQYDGLEYDNTSVFQRPLPIQTPFSNPGGQVPLFSTVGSHSHSIPTSPLKDWANGSGSVKEKRMRASSPDFRSHNELRRGDGIRKKNARFEIPAERNLQNIDDLIARSTDDQEIKELKQQKRLLRNRQAALDSRQRKKMHTERLEDEKKQYTAIISNMEEDIAELNLKLEQVLGDHEQLSREHEQVLRDKELYQVSFENLRMEKENMMQTHTIETAELRKKVSVLTDHVHGLESASLANNTGYSNGFNDMDNMTMDAPWENMGFMGGEFSMEQDIKQELQIIPTKKADAEMDKPTTQGGLLFMLFLVGAFVLSNRSTPSIPLQGVSDDLREASATLLDNIFKDAGVAETAPDAVMAPQPSGTSWDAMAMQSAASMNGVAPAMLGELSDSLTQPTQEQTNEQIFSLTAAQYNGINSQDFLQNPPTRSTSQGRRNLAESLATMRNSGKHSAAEVYTRSLLWDQIPSDVVRTFAKMVADVNAPNGGGHSGTS